MTFEALLGSGQDYYLTRAAYQHGMALIYLLAFLVAYNQFVPLLGEKGLLPVPRFIKWVTFRHSPSLFLFFPKDYAFKGAALAGIILSLLALSGVSEQYGLIFSMAVWGLLWLLYLSFVNVGQTFYSFGWESMLLEAGFYAMLMGDAAMAPSMIPIWAVRLMLFRNMFGAGLIKLRGDPCWWNLTCLYYHYETQPIPNPLSWYFHWLPKWMHRLSVFFNHIVELPLPFLYFAPQPIAGIAGLITIFFHAWLTVSGNFAFLGLLTIVTTIPTLDDRLLGLLYTPQLPEHLASPLPYQALLYLFALLLVWLHINPIKNLFSSRQAMNTTYNPLHLVNSYGAFGSITRPRYEVVIEGTDEPVILPDTVWKEYEFKGKPGRLNKLPIQVAPYHLRLDWLMWFAGFSRSYAESWFGVLLGKLLESDPATLKLIKHNPFPDAPPRFVRALRYEYYFTSPRERRATGNWWRRKLVGIYMPPVKKC